MDFRIQGQSGASRVLVGQRLEELPKFCTAEKVVVVTDEKVQRLHSRLFPANITEIVVIGQGEGCKTLSTVQSLYEKFLNLEMERDSLVVAIGGGIVCDVAGFAAATYLRGMDCGFVPTTVLAQADAGVGGKNGVNLHRYKNLIGTFRQPKFVLCDPRVLVTLPPEQIRNGFAEVIKSAAIADAALFDFLEANRSALLQVEPGVAEKAIAGSLGVKVRIVSADETEQGERRKLNFGHTLGHAVEKVSALAHGEAVSIGMAFAARVSVERKLSRASDVDMLERLLDGFGLPIRLQGSSNAIMDALSKDKKREGASIHMALLRGIGDSLVVSVEIKEIEKLLARWC